MTSADTLRTFEYSLTHGFLARLTLAGSARSRLRRACTARRSSGGRPSSRDAGRHRYPTPYTAQQIRDATRLGRAYTWRVEHRGHPTLERTIEFTAVDAEGAEITVGGEAKRVTWEELRRHAEFPREQVTTREETVTVPAGTYDCVVYVVDDRSKDETWTYYFAKSMPGAPVLFFIDSGGARQMTNTLVRYVSGNGG